MTDSVQDITKALLAAMAGDATLQTVLGGSPVDPRLYWFFQATAARILDAGGGYIVYSLLNGPEVRGGVGEPVYKLTIWARTPDVVENARDRLFVLFQQKTLTTTGSRTLFGKCVHENDEFQEHDNFAGKTVHVRLGWSAN